jgi:uncharacterized protein
MKYKQEFIKIIHKSLPKCKIYLFGSRARGSHSHGSDVDIAIDVNEKVEKNVVGVIREEIENSNIPYFVDIVDLNVVSEEMKKNILREGVLWSN